MADINIVNENQIGECVANAITDLNDRLWKLKERGFDVEMPEKMDFQMIVVKSGGWQALEVVGTEKGTTKETGGTTETGTSKEITKGTDNGSTIEKQGGFQTESSNGVSSDTQNSTDKKVSRGENEHAQNSEETTTTKS